MVVSQTSTICPIRACVSLILSKYPTWYWPTFEPCRHDLTHAFCVSILFHHPRECKFSLEVLTLIEDIVLDVGIWEREREFFSNLSIRPSWIKKTSNEVQQAESWSVTRFYNGAMSPTHGRKSFMRDREVFLLPNYPDDLLSPRSMCPSSFLVLPTPHRKSQDDISFKGGGQ
jgi:hypothetical protein